MNDYSEAVPIGFRQCCKIIDNKRQSKFKDVVVTDEGFYYTVHMCYCVVCGSLVDSRSWVE